MTSPYTRTSNILRSLRHFQTYFGLLPLRPYQLEAAQAVIESVLRGDGETFVWKFARQGGKDETLTALYIYIMMLFSRRRCSIVSAAPTFKPQTELAMRRLEDRLTQNVVLKRSWGRHSGYTFNIHRASTHFFSADSSASVLGATAFPLLVMNEAQDISPAIYDRRFAPMAAANNATRLFSGTAWTSDTLLAREERLCRLKEEQDGRQRVFLVDGYDIAAVHPPYGIFLEDQIARMGFNHPIIRTQYFCQEIDAQSAMFNETRLALVFGSPLHRYSDGEGLGVGFGRAGLRAAPASPTPAPLGAGAGSPLPHLYPDGGGSGRGSGVGYAFLLDVAGQDESASDLEGLSNPGRDSTTLSIVEVDLSTLETLQAPAYRVVMRYSWTGENHLAVFGKIKALAAAWNPGKIAIDATGVGEGLWAMIDKAFPTRVIPVKFTRQLKSEIGWKFLSIIETGRFQDVCSPLHLYSNGEGPGVGSEGLGVGFGRATNSSDSPLQTYPFAQHSERSERVGEGLGVGSDTVRLQYAKCESQILPGPQKTLRWGVPDGTRGPDGQLVHDDFILADSLVAVLDKLPWTSHSATLIVQGRDPLLDMDGNY